MNQKLGFGCMRLPMNGEKVDYDEFHKMIDYYMEQGFNYFDTAHGYVEGKSETAIRECLVKRYPRESYILTDKLTQPYFQSQEEIRTFFEKQLEWCGVEYFDYYLMHAQDRNTYPHFQKNNAYSECLKLKEEGKIKHLGISFHDTAEMLEEILTEHPEVEIVQIQFNYADYESASVQSKKVYEVCRKFHKPVIVMEPVRGGRLVNLPEYAKELLDGLNQDCSYASYAIRFAASFEGMYSVLSGMSNFEQLKDNVDYMKEFKPLTEKEMETVLKVGELLRSMGGIPCTACRYCIEGCPAKISIPDLFSCYNTKVQFQDWNAGFYYNIHTKDGHGKASDCIKCGKCEKICPQHLKIRDLLTKVAASFEEEK
ncbi:MAG: aldo/keto reductase [Clostridia bacterium]|nr:aldo/keto reductase [Clostridia bacterium]